MAKNPTRRAVLKAGPAVVVAPAALAAPQDPILPLYRQWREAHEAWKARVNTHDWEGPEMTALAEREEAAFNLMIDMTPTSLAGIAALAHVMWSWTALWAEGTEEREAEIDSCENLMLAAIWRAASGEVGVPPI